jgi:hypothetical protein
MRAEWEEALASVQATFFKGGSKSSVSRLRLLGVNTGWCFSPEDASFKACCSPEHAFFNACGSTKGAFFKALESMQAAFFQVTGTSLVSCLGDDAG